MFGVTTLHGIERRPIRHDSSLHANQASSFFREIPCIPWTNPPLFRDFSRLSRLNPLLSSHSSPRLCGLKKQNLRKDARIDNVERRIAGEAGCDLFRGAAAEVGDGFLGDE